MLGRLLSGFPCRKKNFCACEATCTPGVATSFQQRSLPKDMGHSLAFTTVCIRINAAPAARRTFVACFAALLVEIRQFAGERLVLVCAAFQLSRQ